MDLAKGDEPQVTLESALGTHVVTFGPSADEVERLRVTVRFTPVTPMLVPSLPRDVYPLDAHDDPLAARGVVEAGQRGLNVGLVYFRIDQPTFGNVLYFQNLTAMNEFYTSTGTKPDGAVGGVWPELGYLPPSPPQSGTPPVQPLEARQEITLSDAILVFRHDAPSDERVSARQFVQMLGAAYKLLDLPPTTFRHWPERARRTLRHLDIAPGATIRHVGHRYIHSYTAAEYPDIRVQMSLISALHDWEQWQGEAVPFAEELKAGLSRFFDAKLGTLRRYLPNVGKDKNADAVDSWHLYHPLLSLVRLEWRKLPKPCVMTAGGDALRARLTTADRIDYPVPANGRLVLTWE